MAFFYSSGHGLVDLESLTGGPGPVEPGLAPETPAAEHVPAFTPLGIGEPLCVEILTVFTGDAPRKFLGGKPDLMVTSGIKSVQTFDAAPRAVNLIEEDIPDHKYLKPGAFSNGSPVVYYTPALDASTIFLSFELVVDSIRKNNITSVSNLFASAAGLPLFTPANSFLLAGATIVRLVGDLVNALESAPFLSGSIDLRFLTSGVPVFRSGHYVMYNDEHRGAFVNYRIGRFNDGFGNVMIALVHKQTGEAYRGNAPYLIINIDGKERPDLDGYVPKLASASLLEQFYGKELGQQAITTLDRSLELYNDMEYRRKAERILEKITTLTPTSEEFMISRLLFDAYNRNIRNPLFRIEWPG